MKNIRCFDVNSSSCSFSWELSEYYLKDQTKFEFELDFQVKFYRAGYRTDGWSYSDITREKSVSLNKLQPSTKYTCYFLYRIREALTKKLKGKWITLKEPLEFKTWSLAKEERFQNFIRITMFFEDKLVEYEEPEHKPDSYLAKAARGIDGMVSVATVVGLGGSYAKLARNIWKFREIGFSALIFRQEISQVVAALGTQLNEFGKKLGLSSRELLIGCYYYLWETKKTRLYNPDLEFMKHEKKRSPHVLEEKVSEELLQNLDYYFKFARIVYKSHPAKVQWILRKLNTTSKNENDDDFNHKLIIFKAESSQNKPGFGVFADSVKREVVFTVRGTKMVEDLFTNHSFQTSDLIFKSLPDQIYKAHDGMLKAARWLISGSFNISQEEENGDEDEDGAGLKLMILQFHDKGYKIKLCGHSLGAAVATLAALLLIDELNDLDLEVYGYATPPCVDYFVTTSTQLFYDETEINNRASRFFKRLKIYNYINRDDLVPRLSLYCLENCAMEIKRTQPLWEQYVNEDTRSFTQKAMSFWEPNQRSRLKKAEMEQTEVENASDCLAVVPTEEKKKDQLGQVEVRLFIPGVIIHSYLHNGITKAALVTGEFESFSKIEAFENMQEDHYSSNIALSLKSIAFARTANSKPNQWVGVSGDFNCAVCRYFVGWNSSVGGASSAVGARSGYHCFQCGQIVCQNCSTTEKALPQIGVISSVRVCDACNVL